ncbi:MAG: hypothetical protein MR432_00355 [Prevotellaceae bacterium]|nr:hypothetical protein [Prevotellaceae bacterium]
MKKSGAKKAGDGAARLEWYCAVCISQAQKQSFVCRFFMILTLVSEAVSGRAKTYMAYRKKYKPYILK